MTSSLRVAEFSVKTRKDTGVNTAHMNSTAPTMITIPLTRTGLASLLHDDQPAGRPLQGFAQLGPTWPQRPASPGTRDPAHACTSADDMRPLARRRLTSRTSMVTEAVVRVPPACPRRAPHPLNARNAPISTRRSGLLIPSQTFVTRCAYLRYVIEHQSCWVCSARMKITGYRIVPTVLDWGRRIGDVNGVMPGNATPSSVVLVETDSDLTGVAIGHGGPIDRVFPAVEGEDPRSVTALFDRMLAWTFKAGHAGSVYGAIGTIDLALWDIKAKAAGEPLWRLLGARDRAVPGYASGLDAGLDDNQLHALYTSFAQAGFTG